MKVGEVCLFTKDVVRLANFYKSIFDIDNGSNDNIHQFIISEETSLSVYNDGAEREMNAQNICIAFTVDDVDFQYERLTTLGVKILEPPTIRPWGVKNLPQKGRSRQDGGSCRLYEKKSYLKSYWPLYIY